MLFGNERENHRLVKQAITALEREKKSISLNVKTIADRSGVSMRKTKLHLGLLEEDGLGLFCDDLQQTFTISKEILKDYGK